jgi:branched-chain amino acid aminotransferase
MNINYQLKKRINAVNLPDNLGFGKYFTDHVFEMDYSKGEEWHNATIKPLEDLSMHPGTMFMHYGQAIFEGLKAYYTVNDELHLFRPEKNLERLNNSAKRLCMPEVNIEEALEALKDLVAIEKNWIPRGENEALYIRPFMLGTEPFLGVKPSQNYKFIYLLSPVGAYYAEGFKPVKILVQDEYVRAVRKGLGECKTPANYAASLLGAEVAKKQGYAQVLWLDAVELKYIEEVGTMNIFIRFDDEVVTPALTGGILPGITRLSVIQLLKEWGENVNERKVSVDEFVEKHKQGKVLEVFGTGTAALISPVAELNFKGEKLIMNDGKIGELSQKLFDELTGIQYGRKDDTHDWIVKVKEWVDV